MTTSSTTEELVPHIETVVMQETVGPAAAGKLSTLIVYLRLQTGRWWEWVALWLGAPLICLLITPWLRPFRWSRLLLTYALPLIPAGVLWDGTASLFRLYPPAHLQRLARAADPTGRYAWQCGVLPAGFGRCVTYLVGVPQ